VFPHGKIHGKATESTVDILYQLGTHNDASLLPRFVYIILTCTVRSGR